MADLQKFLILQPNGTMYMASFNPEYAIEETNVRYALPDDAEGPVDRYSIVDGEVVDAYPGKTETEVNEILRLKAESDPDRVREAQRAKIQAIRSHFNTIMVGLKADVAPYELETWTQQANEYDRYQTDSSKPTPWIDGLAKGRGITREQMVTLIGRKIEAMASIQGAQHRLEKLVEAAKTLSEVSAVEIKL